MLYALAHPLSLVILLASFVVGLTLHGWVQALLADRLGERAPRAERRLRPDPRRQLDPFGCVSAAVSGLGWARPVEFPDRRRKAALVSVVLVGPLLNLALGAGALVAYGLLYDAPVGGAALVLQRGLAIPAGRLAPAALALTGLSQLYLGVLSLVPLPPLDGGRLLFGLAPRTLGWQKAEHQLIERNIGVAVLLALLLFPLGGPLPLLPTVLDTVLGPLVRLLTGG